ncbi:MAG: flagellar protein FlgN [Defluviitaleaceae bacterium]|nr:flagellar protein FlgN [Defluviitaleaceae bacterium]
MAGLISNLIEVLQGQTKLFNDIAALSDDKREFTVKNDIESLRGIVKQENEIVPKMLKGDKKRESIMTDLATVLNKNKDDLTLTLLEEIIRGQPEHGLFKQTVDEFIAALEKMKEGNERAKVLLQDAIDYVEFNMNILHSSMDAGPVGYGALEDGHQPGSFLDTRS